MEDEPKKNDERPKRRVRPRSSKPLAPRKDPRARWSHALNRKAQGPTDGAG